MSPRRDDETEVAIVTCGHHEFLQHSRSDMRVFDDGRRPASEELAIREPAPNVFIGRGGQRVTESIEIPKSGGDAFAIEVAHYVGNKNALACSTSAYDEECAVLVQQCSGAQVQVVVYEDPVVR